LPTARAIDNIAEKNKPLHQGEVQKKDPIPSKCMVFRPTGTRTGRTIERHRAEILAVAR
jgi:hypothetical protein